MVLVFELSRVLHVYWLVFRQQSWAYMMYVLCRYKFSSDITAQVTEGTYVLQY